MDKMTFSSPSKINLTLDVIRKSRTGYHEIRSIMMPIQLHDTIKITKTRTGKITLKTTGLPCPQGSENIAYRAAKSFFEATKIRPAVMISLYKRIPLASGLGGGSSNAATVLRGLNELYGAPLSMRKLYSLAIKIGMDVPFFLHPILSLTTHFGEKCMPIQRKNPTLPRIKLLLPKTKKKSTAHAYAALDISLCNKRKADTSKLLKLLKNSPLSWDSSWNSLLHNDFLQLYTSKSTGQKIGKKMKNDMYITGAGPMRYAVM